MKKLFLGTFLFLNACFLSREVHSAVTVDAGTNQNLTLNGVSISSTLQGDVVASSMTTGLSWSVISGVSSNVQIASAISTTTTVTFLAAGAYVFQLSVYEVPGGTTTDTVTIQVILPTPVTRDNVILPQSKNVIEPGQPARIRFRLSTSGTTSMTIYGRGGTIIEKLIDNEFMSVGDHEKFWTGQGAGNGTYKVRIEQDGRLVKDFYIVVAR